MSSGWLYLNGTRHMGAGDSFVSLDPASGDVIWEGNAASRADVDRAVQAAEAAFEDWSERPFAEREALVRRFGEQLKAHQEVLARTIGLETGKPLWETRTEVASMIGKIEFSVQAWKARTGESETQANGVTSRLRHRPHGVVAVFGPYNFPGHLPNGHIVPALLAGNCVLFKPSELTPRVAEETVALWEAAGLPPGVLQLLQGERETGEAIAQHPRLDGLYFTGSSRTGLILHQQFAAHPGKILALEMGGNNPLVVGRFSNRRAVVHDIVQSAFLSTGQRCTCARRLYVPQGEAGDALVADLLAAAAALRIGRHDEDPQPFMGPLISTRSADQLLAAQTRLITLGAEPLLEMKRLKKLGSAFVSPAVLEVSGIEHLPDEEYFGPLLQLARYASFDEALRLASQTRYGLSAGLLSEDESEWARFQRRLRAGIVNRNRPTTGASGGAPFGGIGHSGNHRPSAFYAADYCAYPVASVIGETSVLPAS
ncbi:MAG TPA: succinylglutamate-semialdehyde dehydrogenase, partial [Nevskiaceae bacterium]|nr:succinylglutamate-semialdehyde dehydrogenase [Nevskiaceae bacterium]